MPKLRFAGRLTASMLHLVRDRKANVAVMFAVMMVPCVYLLGMTLDYTQAVRKRSQLNAALDAAVIAAVTPSMMTQTNAAAVTAATNVFNATASNLPGLSGQPSLNINVSGGLVRTVTASYTAASTNNFPILLGTSSWSINGTSTSSASGAPNINFYLLLDDSPSMAIAANPNDIATLIANTQNQIDPVTGARGCGFACHESNPSADNLGNPGGIDNYQLARNLNLTLRIDLVAQAVSKLMTTAQQKQAQNNNTYKAAIYSFDYGLNTIYAPSGLPSANLTTAASQAASNIQLLQVYDNNCLTRTNCNNDTDTNIENALQSVNTVMPNPGGGTNNAGDTPQEVVFLVTDGVDDLYVSNPAACLGNVYTYNNPTRYRCHQPINPAICTTIQNRGIRIAVLYTEYLQLPTDYWYNNYVASFNAPSPSAGQIAQNLQACASPNLFYDVQSGQDIAAALNILFQKVITSAARLTN